MSRNNADIAKGAHLKHVFGLRNDLSHCFHYVDENIVAFVAGHNLVLHQIDDKTQSFIPGINHGASLGSNGITAIDVYVPKKLLLLFKR